MTQKEESGKALGQAAGNYGSGLGCFAWLLAGMIFWLPGFGTAIVELVNRLGR